MERKNGWNGRIGKDLGGGQASHGCEEDDLAWKDLMTEGLVGSCWNEHAKTSRSCLPHRSLLQLCDSAQSLKEVAMDSEEGRADDAGMT